MLNMAILFDICNYSCQLTNVGDWQAIINPCPMMLEGKHHNKAAGAHLFRGKIML